MYHVPAFVARLKDAQATGEQILSDLGTWPKLLKEIEEFHEEIKEYQRDTFDRQVVISMTPTFTSNRPPKIKSFVYPDFH